jgi:hypothetical protein
MGLVLLSLVSSFKTIVVVLKAFLQDPKVLKKPFTPLIPVSMFRFPYSQKSNGA